MRSSLASFSKSLSRAKISNSYALRCKKPAVAVDENGIYPNLAAKMQISWLLSTESSLMIMHYCELL